MVTRAKGRRDTYHHGDLSAALVRATLEIVDEAGVRGFSVSEAARRTGVSPGAPYRHFADRDALLAAAALEVSRRVNEMYVEAVADIAAPEDRLAVVGEVYVRAAARFRGGFDILFHADLRAAHPELRDSGRALIDMLLPDAFALVPDGGHELAVTLLEALAALTRGYAALLLSGLFGEPGEAAERVAARATTTARALVRGFCG
ncbi:TetR/AcrR family transcriptional regulator [Streptomyces xinghaiensis]|uniref:TetR/AcrR family transcriptional regulator n=1 Tax=Streptomyces xinghaiensis TaxID=1038928 RepID=UPI000BAED817|nr:TetR/AcrR family transcriptional regulator [Streptomyces xinghaiensis]